MSIRISISTSISKSIDRVVVLVLCAPGTHRFRGLGLVSSITNSTSASIRIGISISIRVSFSICSSINISSTSVAHTWQRTAVYVRV